MTSASNIAKNGEKIENIKSRVYIQEFGTMAVLREISSGNSITTVVLINISEIRILIKK